MNVKKRSRLSQSKNPLWTAVLTVSLLFVVSMALTTTATLHAQETKVEAKVEEEYQVSVSAHLIPFYAEDATGEPVFDLKQDEIQLFVNKKPTSLMGLSRFQYDISDVPELQDQTDAQARELKRKIREQQKRFVFVVVDAIFNHATGINRAEAICRHIITDSPDTDAFILMINMPDKGLTYIVGPTDNRPLLNKGLSILRQKGLEALKDQKKRFKNYGNGIIRKRNANTSIIAAADDKDAVISLAYEENRTNTIETRAIKKGRADMLTNALAQLQHALKTITRPKIVYFISAGVPGGLMSAEATSDYFQHLENAAKLINSSGTILYVVNSFSEIANLQSSGDDMLKQLAQAGSGKYFTGKNVEKVASQIRRSTAAYYELAFSPIAKKRMAIDIKCKRPGINVFSVSQTEKALPYREMKKLQKRLFALNIVTRGSWSRMVGEVGIAPIAKKSNYGKNLVGVEVNLPEMMRNRKLDIYTINLEPQTLKADFEVQNIDATDKIEIKGKKKNNRKMFFVIIDPKTTTCIYNKMI